MTGNLVGSLGKTISNSINKSLSGFGSGLKGAFIAGNPALHGAIVDGFSKMMKNYRNDKEDRNRSQAFDQEKTLEQKKLFTDILNEQKKSSKILSDILKALLALKNDENILIKLLTRLGFLITEGFIKGFDKLVKLFRGFLELLKTKFDDLLARFRSILKFLENGLARLGKIVNFITDIFRSLGNGLLRFLDFLKNFKIKFPALDNLFKFFGDLPRRFDNFFKNLFERFKKLPFIDDLIKFFSGLPNRFRNIFDDVLGKLKNAFDDFKTRFKLPSFDDIIKKFDDFKARFKLPNFDDIIKKFDDFKARFKALPFVDDILRFFSETIPSRFNDMIGRFKALPFVDDILRFFSETIPSKFTALSNSVKSFTFDDIIKFFQELPSKFRLPNFDDLVRGIEGLFDMLPQTESLRRLRNATLINFAVIADMVDDAVKTIDAKFESFKGFLGNTGTKILSYLDEAAKVFSGVFDFIGSKISVAIDAIKNSEVVKVLGDIARGLLKKVLIPLDFILSIYDGLQLAFSEEKIGKIIDKNATEVTFMDRVAAFLGGFVSSFFLGIVDVVSKLLDYTIKNIFGDGVTWKESYDTGLQEIGTIYLTRLIGNIFDFVKNSFKLIGSLLTFDGEGIKKAFNDIGLVLEDLVYNIFNFIIETVDRLGIRKYIIRMFNFFGELWNDISNAVGESIFNMKKIVYGYIGKAIDATVNSIGPIVTDMFNSIAKGVAAVASWVTEKVGTVLSHIPLLGDVAKKLIDFSKNLQVKEVKFERYESNLTKQATQMKETGFKKSVFIPQDEKYNRERDAFVSELQRRNRMQKSFADENAMYKAALPTKKEDEKVTASSSSSPLSVRNNNPGNLRYYASYAVPGGVLEHALPGPEESFARFPTPEAGMEAMRRQIVLDTQTKGKTLAQFISKYAPTSENNTANYINIIGKEIGLGPNDRVPPEMIPSLQRAMIRIEGGEPAAKFYAGVKPNTGIMSSSFFDFKMPSIAAISPQYSATTTPAKFQTNNSLGVSPGAVKSTLLLENDNVISILTRIQNEVIKIAQNTDKSNSISVSTTANTGEQSKEDQIIESKNDNLFANIIDGIINEFEHSYTPILESHISILTGIQNEVIQIAQDTDKSDSTSVSATANTEKQIINVLNRIEEDTQNNTEVTVEVLNEMNIALGETSNVQTKTAARIDELYGLTQELVTISKEDKELNEENQKRLKKLEEENKKYNEQRKNLEKQFLGQIQSDISKAISKSLGPAGIGVTGDQKSAFGSINQLYQNAFQKFATKLMGKDLGPTYGTIFSQLAASYTDQFVNQVLGPMFGPNGTQGFNRAINNYTQGANVRKQYDLLRQDYNKMESDFKQLSSQITLVDRLNALKPMTGKPSQEKLNLIQQINTMEKALAQKGIQLGKAKEAKDANKKMVYEDLIFAMTGIPTGMRSMLGYEKGIQNFSQQMALMIGKPFSGAFGGAGGYEEYKKEIERQMKLGVDAQGNALEQGAAQMRDGMVMAGDYHNQGMGFVLGTHLEGMANITQANLQAQTQLIQQQGKMLSSVQFGGGGGESFLGTLFNKGIDFLANIFGGGGGISNEMETQNIEYIFGSGEIPTQSMVRKIDNQIMNSQSTGFFETIGQGFKDVSESVSILFKDMFKPSTATPTGAGGTIPGQTGPSQPAGKPAFSFGDMLASFGGQYLGAKLGQTLGVKNNFGGMILQAGINQTAGTVLSNLMKGQSLTTGLGNITGTLAGIGKGIFSPQIGIGNMIGKFAGSKFMTNLAPNFAGSLGQFGTAFANPAIFGNSLAGGTLGELATSQLLGSLGGAAMSGFSTYGLSKSLSGGYSLGKGDALSKIAGIAGAANTLGLFGAGTLGLTAGAGGLGGLFASGAGLLGTNPLGLAILGIAVLGNRLFGRKPPKVTGEGITGTLGEGTETSLQNYRDIFQKGGWFRSDKNYTEYSATDTELVRYMQASINDVFGGVRGGAKIMGIDPNAITGFTQQIKLNMQGMSQEDQTKTIMNSLKDFSDAMLNHAYPALSQFTLEGEKLYETFTRLTQSTEFMNTAFEMLLYDAEDLAKTIGGKTGLELANLKYEIMSMFGGKDLQEQQDNFTKFVGDYYKLFYTQQEQLTFSLNQKKKQFEDIEKEIKNKINIPGLNIEIPEFKGTVEESRQAYRQFIDDYVKNTSLATEDQRAIYAQLIQAGPLFYQGAQEFVALNQQQKKTKTREELIEEGSKFTQAFDSNIEAMNYAVGIYEDSPIVKAIDDMSSTNYVIDDLTSTPINFDNMLAVEPVNFYDQLLEQQRILNNGGTKNNDTKINTVVDNSVRSNRVTAPSTTIVMNDDKVRDFHPILRNTERSSLRAYSLAMR